MSSTSPNLVAVKDVPNLATDLQGDRGCVYIVPHPRHHVHMADLKAAAPHQPQAAHMNNQQVTWGQQRPSLKPYLASLTLWYVQLICLEISISLCSSEFLHCISKCASLNKTKKLPNSTSEKPQMIHITKANGTKQIHVSNKKNPKCNRNVAGNFPIYHH
jgi:hypothetical protein